MAANPGGFDARVIGGKCERRSATAAPITHWFPCIYGNLPAAMAPGEAPHAGGILRGVLGLCGTTEAQTEQARGAKYSASGPSVRDREPALGHENANRTTGVAGLAPHARERLSRREPWLPSHAGGARPAIVGFSHFPTPRHLLMQLTRLRAKNQITLPASIVTAIGLREGDILRITAEQDRVIITAQEIRERGRTYTMSDWLGAAGGLYDSVAEIDAEIEAGRAE